MKTLLPILVALSLCALPPHATYSEHKTPPTHSTKTQSAKDAACPPRQAARRRSLAPVRAASAAAAVGQNLGALPGGLANLRSAAARVFEPPNVQVNNVDTNATNLANDTVQSEPSLAASGSTVVVGWNDFNQFAATGVGGLTSITGFGFSTNGGMSFTDAGELAPAAGFVNLGDSAIAADGAGNFYFASLALDDAFTDAGWRVAVAQSTSTSPAVTFGRPVQFSGLTTTGLRIQDKELIAVDTSGGEFNGRVYVTWMEAAVASDRLSATTRILTVHSTTTSPLAFSPTAALSPTGDIASNILNTGSMPAVGPGGELYVVWGRYGLGRTGITSESIRLLRSTPGGVDLVNPDASDSSANKIVASPTPTSGNMTSGGIRIKTKDFPYIAVDRTPAGSPTSGNVYIVFQADPDGAGPDRSDIFFTRSTNRGATWSRPHSISGGLSVPLGGDTTYNDNWQPFIAVSPTTGQIDVTFYDRRDDMTLADGDLFNTRIALYRAVSTDGGLSWFNERVSTGSFRPNTNYDSAAAPDYMGDYNYVTAEGSNFHYTWGDCRNTCTPPAGATSPCTPPGRSDQDVFYARNSVITGPDLFITPWGAATGEGALWQTSDIFVVDAADGAVNAAKGTVNRLRARIRNLGNAPATGAVIRFRYAPAFVGLADSALRTIGTVPVDFAAAGDSAGNDVKVVPIDWDLTNTGDTNDGQWRMPVRAFDHFCVRVSVEFPADANQSNNKAQNNFFDVGFATGMGGGGGGSFSRGSGGGPSAGVVEESAASSAAELSSTSVTFMVGNPYDTPVDASLSVSLPGGFSARLCEFPGQLGRRFKLRAKEVLVTTIVIVAPDDLASRRFRRDAVADINLQIGRELVGGISLRLARANETEPPAGTPRTVVRVPEESRPPEPAGVVHERGVQREFDVAPEFVFRAVRDTLDGNREPIALADPVRGLVNTQFINVDARRLSEIVAEEIRPFIGERSGRYMLSFRIEPTRRGTRVTVAALIILDLPVETPLGGRPVASSGALERQHLDELARRLVVPG
jgi:3D (Asp-Asp-Asp) domain-containing protein